jgi:hypothetical protein
LAHKCVTVGDADGTRIEGDLLIPRVVTTSRVGHHDFDGEREEKKEIKSLQKLGPSFHAVPQLTRWGRSVHQENNKSLQLFFLEGKPFSIITKFYMKRTNTGNRHSATPEAANLNKLWRHEVPTLGSLAGAQAAQLGGARGRGRVCATAEDPKKSTYQQPKVAGGEKRRSHVMRVEICQLLLL